MELQPIFNNEMSIQLYAPDITEEKILELVKNGADVNYTKIGYDPIPVEYAKNKTNQGLKNMIAIIQCGARLNSFSPFPSYSCLVTAVKNKNTNMILLIISHEDKTIFTRERKPPHATFAIDSAFYDKNLVVIKALVEKQLITPNYGLEKYTYWKQPSQEIIEYLISKGATNPMLST